MTDPILFLIYIALAVVVAGLIYRDNGGILLSLFAFWVVLMMLGTITAGVCGSQCFLGK